MTQVLEIFAALLVLVALVFMVSGIVGLFRFPDAYTRLQASALAGTSAVLSIIMATALLANSWQIALRLVLIMLFFLVSSPTGAHIVARYAWDSGLSPWKAP
jgi:multicomponent Na+:H+ antiporter subunit G